MSRKTSNFMVGLFVAIGVVIGAGVLVWLGASQYLRKGSSYVTYFDESVQGLEADSSVKYRGVDVGRVEEIKVAPDCKLVEVVMKIDLKGNLTRDTVAQLRTAGITGIVFIELDRRDPGAPGLSAPITFATDYPIIPSRPSEIKRMLAGIDDIIGKLKEINFVGVSNQVESTLKAVKTFVAGERMSATVAKLEVAAANLEGVTRRVDRMVAEGGVEEVLVETRGTLAEARAAISAVKDDFRGLKLAETGERVNRLVGDMQGQTRAASVQIRATSEHLRRASEALEILLERLNSSPSDLLFSQPPPERGGK